MSQKTIRSVCRSCHGGCGVLVRVEDNTVKEIKGDPDCPVNRGWLCVKGKKYHTIAHHPDRLKDPLLRTKGGYKAIPWEEAFDRAGGHYRSALSLQGERGGPAMEQEIRDTVWNLYPDDSFRQRLLGE